MIMTPKNFWKYFYTTFRGAFMALTIVISIFIIVFPPEQRSSYFYGQILIFFGVVNCGMLFFNKMVYDRNQKDQKVFLSFTKKVSELFLANPFISVVLTENTKKNLQNNIVIANQFEMYEISDKDIIREAEKIINQGAGDKNDRMQM